MDDEIKTPVHIPIKGVTEDTVEIIIQRETTIIKICAWQSTPALERIFSETKGDGDE